MIETPVKRDLRGAAFPLLPSFACLSAVVFAGIASDGGHLSLDSVKQLFEAATGRSASWSPPFMSALLSVLGGTPFQPRVAAMGFVALVCLLTWGGLLLASSHPVAPRFMALRGLLVAALVLHPVMLVYSGIVWKDVLFAALCAVSLGSALRSLAESSPSKRLAWGAAALGFAALLPEVRQHGIFVLPSVLAIVLLGVAWLDGWTRTTRGVVVAALLLQLLVVHLGAGHWAESRIVNEGSTSTSVGLRSIAIFDLLGIERRVDVGPLRKQGLSAEADHVLGSTYTPDRIDFVNATPPLQGYFAGRKTESLLDDWRGAVLDYPTEYGAHRWAVTLRLLGSGGACLPVHVGVSGLASEVDALGLDDEIDRSDATVYGIVQPLFETLLFHHGSHIALLLGLFAVLPFLPLRTRLVLGATMLAPAAYGASFIVTGIACDFRYLYPALVMTILVAIAMVSGWRERSDVERGGWR